MCAKTQVQAANTVPAAAPRAAEHGLRREINPICDLTFSLPAWFAAQGRDTIWSNFTIQQEFVRGPHVLSSKATESDIDCVYACQDNPSCYYWSFCPTNATDGSVHWLQACSMALDL